jgi:hypothetical protein
MKKQFQALDAVLMTDPSCALRQAMFDLFGLSTSLLARAIGVDPVSLDWWIFENDCGARGHSAGWGENMAPMRSLDDYVDLLMYEAEIEADA